MDWRLSLGAMFLCAFSTLAWAAAEPKGLLIYKSADSTLRVSEYRAINQRIVPATDFITATHLDGQEEIVKKTAVLKRLDYTSAPPTILDNATAGMLQQQIQELAQIGTQYPQARPYLEPRIKGLEQEVSAYGQGHRKLNGTWLTGQQFQARLQAEKQRLAQVQRPTEPVQATPVPVVQPQITKSSPVVLHQAPRLPLASPVTKTVLFENGSPGLLELAICLGIVAGLTLLAKTLAKGGRKSTCARPSSPQPPACDSDGTTASASLDSLDWDEFEILVGEIFRRKGYGVEISAGDGADGGIDLVVNRNGEISAVQCKHWKAYKVGVKEIREFFGVLVAGGLDHGYFVTTGVFTGDAQEFAEGKPMELIDREQLEALMQEVSLPGENLLDLESWIGRFTDTAQILHPDCPICRNPMVLREKRSGGMFWGCSQFAASGCRGKRNARTLLFGAHTSDSWI